VRKHAAAQSRSLPAAGQTKAGAKEKGEKDDLDALAREVYDEIRRLMEAARDRNGDPWQ